VSAPQKPAQSEIFVLRAQFAATADGMAWNLDIPTNTVKNYGRRKRLFVQNPVLN
jgi:hypothetical protein